MEGKSLPFWQDQSGFLEAPLIRQANTLSFWAKLVNCAHRVRSRRIQVHKEKKASHHIIIETL